MSAYLLRKEFHLLEAKIARLTSDLKRLEKQRNKLSQKLLSLAMAKAITLTDNEDIEEILEQRR